MGGLRIRFGAQAPTPISIAIARAQLALAGRTVGLAVTGNFSSTFPATENPISEGGQWVRGLAEGLDWSNPATALGSDGTTRIAYGTQAGHSGAPFDDSIAHLLGFPSNQWVQATVYNASTTTAEIELLLRFALSGHSAIGIELDILSSGQLEVVRWNGAIGNFTVSTTSPYSTNVLVADGAIWYAQLTGSGTGAVLLVKCNGNIVVNDTLGNIGLAAVDSGNPGMGFWVGGNGAQSVQANRKFGWKALSAGSL